jgi:hypothetical protein
MLSFSWWFDGGNSAATRCCLVNALDTCACRHHYNPSLYLRKQAADQQDDGSKCTAAARDITAPITASPAGLHGALDDLSVVTHHKFLSTSERSSFGKCGVLRCGTGAQPGAARAAVDKVHVQLVPTLKDCVCHNSSSKSRLSSARNIVGHSHRCCLDTDSRRHAGIIRWVASWSCTQNESQRLCRTCERCRCALKELCASIR